MERKVVDQAKLEQYASIFYEAYEEFYEVDIKEGILKPLFHTPEKYAVFKAEEEQFFEAACNIHVHPDDRETFMTLFRQENLCGIVENGDRQSVEFRCRRSGGGFLWVRGVLTAPKTGGDNAVFYMIDIENEKKAEELSQVNEGLLSVFFNIYQGMAEVNLENGTAVVLRYEMAPEFTNRSFSWEGLVECFCRQRLYPEDRDIFRHTFSIPRFRQTWEGSRKKISLDVRCMVEEERFQWAEVSAMVVGQGSTLQKVYLTLRNTEEERLLKNIVDRYVYGSCDYFICLDGKHNSYMMFSGSDNGTPLPPVECKDYGTEIVKYARDFVVLEDQEMVIREMELAHVIEMLNCCQEHSFYCGVIDPIRGYTRKRLLYQYYDKENQIILLSRTDVTSMFLEQKRQNQLLKNAMVRAQTDLLTGLANQSVKGMMAKRLLNSMKKAAVLFIDLDNFKVVNDTLGHGKGDKLLKDVASALADTLRTDDLSGRVGGDEFVVLLEPINTIEDVKRCAQRICTSVENVLDQDLYDVSISCSIGIAMYPEDGESVQSLMEQADKAAYAVKRMGKNGYAFISDIKN